ncbi:MAG: DUF1848 domain-containing protein [Oscillospiraceae bacterium]|nr:DUF1848 domain-containing protein [Oscillospiraceae bacterium]
MIISASRRTDIPAFYSDWLINRLNAGSCSVKNPFNPAQIRRVSLLPQDVDGVVLWTKNAAPLLPKRAALDKYKYYFQYTITPYHSDIESGLADKKSVVIPAFIEFARHIGAEHMIWRYDPIIITKRYNFDYHIKAFTKLCELLSGSTKKCIISFVVAYKSVAKSLREVGHLELGIDEKLRLTEALLSIAKDYNITLCACCELAELEQLGVQPISCVNADLFGVNALRDKNQRKGCNCAVSVDIGAYNSCMNGCRYCYANHFEAKVRANYEKHDVTGELILRCPCQ